MIVNDQIHWDGEIYDNLMVLQEYCPLMLEENTKKYIDNLFASGYSDNDFYNNIYLNMYHYYVFLLHAYLVRIYKIYLDNKSLHILQKMKIIGKKFEQKLNIETIKHDIFNSLEKDSCKHLTYLLDFEDDSNFIKRHSDIFKMRDNISHFNELIMSEKTFFEYTEKIIENLETVQSHLYEDTKNIIYNEINDAIKNEVIDEVNYKLYFEEINLKYYLNPHDYDDLNKKGYIDFSNEPETCLVKKYIKMFYKNIPLIMYEEDIELNKAENV